MTFEDRVKALKKIIGHSTDGNELSKKLMIFLIDKSNKLTKNVCVSLIEKHNGFLNKHIYSILDGFNKMIGCEGSTLANSLLEILGSEFCFSCCYGDFDVSREDDPLNSDGELADLDRYMVRDENVARVGMPYRYTFWLSRESFSKDSTLVSVKQQILVKVRIPK